MANADAVRDFTFIASTDTNARSFDIHVAYAEIEIQFAGQGGFAPRSTTVGQTVANTVVVGQKVHAIVKTSDKISLYN